MRRPRGGRIWVLLAASWTLRWVLSLRGGQLFFPDEIRYYYRSLLFLHRLRHAEFGAAARLMAAQADHSFFIPVGGAAIAAQRAVMLVLGQSLEHTMWAAAAFLASASAACIGLVYALARKAGADETEAFIAAALMAGASSMLYFSRHFLPYDASLALLLSALWLGLEKRSSPARSALCGLALGAAFLIYNGSWACCAAVLILHAHAGSMTLSDISRRTAAAGLGAAAPLALLCLAGVGAGLPWSAPLVRLAVTSKAVSQGDLAEGWRLPWEYLWRAEHGLALAWGFAAAAAAWLCLNKPGRDHERCYFWLGGAALTYLLLATASTGLGSMVVYGRAVRQMVPFLCLAAAFASSRAPLGARRALPVLAAALCFQSAYNFARPMLQVWPWDVLDRTSEPIVCALGVDGPAIPATPTGCPAWYHDFTGAPYPRRYVLLNAAYLYPALREKPSPAGRTLWSFPHPLQFEPYLYEGFDPDTRALLRRADISMRLIDTGAG